MTFSRPKQILWIALINLMVLFLFLSMDYLYTWRVRSKQPLEPGIPHPVFHHDLVPLFSGKRWWGPLQYQFFTNSLGFKDRSARVVDLKSTKYRIVTLGDSFTEGSGFPYDETFVGLFDRSLNSTKYEVLNMAVASYCPRWYYAKLDYYLKHGLTVNEVVVFLDISDIPDEVNYETQAFRNEVASSRFQMLLFSAKAQIRKRLSLTGIGVDLIRNLISPQAKPLPMDWLAQREATVPRWTVQKDLLDAWGYRGLAIARGYMEKVDLLCKQSNIKLKLVVYPWPPQIRAGDLHSIQVSYWKEFCSLRSIPFLDAFPYFVNQGDPEAVVKTYFIPGDVHWNAEGHRKMFELVSNFWRSTR